MSDFKERYGHLTVGQALALNEAARCCEKNGWLFQCLMEVVLDE